MEKLNLPKNDYGLKNSELIFRTSHKSFSHVGSERIQLQNGTVAKLAVLAGESSLGEAVAFKVLSVSKAAVLRQLFGC